jgi:DNA-binding Lrp family transcriptional regulator
MIMQNELDQRVIAELQSGIPICPHPYESMAHKLGITEEEFMQKLRFLICAGVMRKFGAILDHHKAGYDANAMVVWKVLDEKILEAGRIMASFPEVTHCYQRPVLPEWRFNLFTMIHGKTKEACDSLIGKIASAAPIEEYQILYSVFELKKTATVYFGEDSNSDEF